MVRTTKSSISIADPDGGRNIRLKGAIYEQYFNAGEGLRAEIESAAADYRRDAEIRIQRAREVCQSGTERKREENQRRAALNLRRAETPLREGEPGSGTIRRGFELDYTGGEIAHDGAGKTVAERIRAATAGLLEKAGRVGERLRGMADDVWSYATGERGAERARHGLEQAGAEFERAAAPVVARLNAIEAHCQHERAAQHQKAPELERAQRQRSYDGPSLG